MEKAPTETQQLLGVADMEAFERGKPELGDPVAKKRKGIGYHLARQKVGQ